MRAIAAVLIVLAGCGQQSYEDGSEALELVKRRRIALGLPETPLRFKKAMQELRSLDAEAVLERETDPEKLRNLALRIENLLQRAEGDLARETGDSRAAAAYLALYPAREDAEQLLKSCTDCHVKHRKER